MNFPIVPNCQTIGSPQARCDAIKDYYDKLKAFFDNEASQNHKDVESVDIVNGKIQVKYDDGSVDLLTLPSSPNGNPVTSINSIADCKLRVELFDGSVQIVRLTSCNTTANPPTLANPQIKRTSGVPVFNDFDTDEEIIVANNTGYAYTTDGGGAVVKIGDPLPEIKEVNGTPTVSHFINGVKECVDINTGCVYTKDKNDILHKICPDGEEEIKRMALPVGGKPVVSDFTTGIDAIIDGTTGKTYVKTDSGEIVTCCGEDEILKRLGKPVVSDFDNGINQVIDQNTGEVYVLDKNNVVTLVGTSKPDIKSKAGVPVSGDFTSGIKIIVDTNTGDLYTLGAKGTPEKIGGGANLKDLDDVDLTGIEKGDTLVYNGTKWEAKENNNFKLKSGRVFPNDFDTDSQLIFDTDGAKTIWYKDPTTGTPEQLYVSASNVLPVGTRDMGWETLEGGKKYGIVSDSSYIVGDSIGTKANADDATGKHNLLIKKAGMYRIDVSFSIYYTGEGVGANMQSDNKKNVMFQAKKANGDPDIYLMSCQTNKESGGIFSNFIYIELDKDDEIFMEVYNGSGYGDVVTYTGQAYTHCSIERVI